MLAPTLAPTFAASLVGDTPPSPLVDAAERAPLRGTHIVRKTCGARIADGGGGVGAVATHLRHKDLATASRYIDRRGASQRALNALES